MKPYLSKAIIISITVCLAVGLLNLDPVYADDSILLTSFGTPYLQDFDTLSYSSASDVLPIGWKLSETGTSANVNGRYQPSTGSATLGDIYSYGSSNSTDRALGSLQDSTFVPMFGASFTNNTGGVIQTLTIKYTGEEWRLNRSARPDKLIFEMSTNATSLENGIWTEYAALTFTTPYQDIEGTKNGNDAKFRTEILSSISGLTIPSGKTFWIRWRDHKIPNGINDGLAVDDFSLIPYGVDDPPLLTEISPIDGASKVAVDANLSVSFSEPVALASGWITLSCSISKAHEITVTGGTQTFDVNPDQNFEPGDICTIVISASKVSDLDATDPPDMLDKDYSFSFSVIPPPDSAPVVVTTDPEIGESDVLLNSSLTVQFSEPVTVKPDWFTLNCTSSGNHSAVVEGGLSTFILIPAKPFVYDESCTLIVKAENIADLDSDDPPDNLPSDFTITFSTLPTPDDAPYLSSSVPANNSPSVPVNQVFEFTFSEPVSLDSTTPILSCESTDVFTLLVSGGSSIFLVKPDRNLNYSDNCSLLFAAQSVTDKDLNDDPDAMLFDQTINFTTEPKPVASPTVDQVVPADGAVNVSVDSDIKVFFHETVSVGNTWAGINCSVSGPHSYTTSGTAQNKVINPDTNFVNNETCTLTIYASEVSSDNSGATSVKMAENYSLSFTTEPADPSPVVETFPVDGAVDVPVDSTLSIKLSQPVIFLNGAVQLSCSISGSLFIASEDDSITFNIYPAQNFVENEVCKVTLKADQVLPKDPKDQPVFKHGDFEFSFTTHKNDDLPPGPFVVSDTAITPYNFQSLKTSLNRLTLQFNKDVLHNGSHVVANFTNNYGLYEWGANHEFNTATCGTPAGDDTRIPIDAIVYDPLTFKEDIFINGGQVLPDGTYRLSICGGTNILDEFGTPLTDAAITFTVAVLDSTSSPDSTQNTGNYGGSGSSNQTTSSNSGSSTGTTNKNYYANGSPLIPVTGFPHGVITLLGPQEVAYTDLGAQWLEIPEMNLNTSITGVPQENDNWDVSWLGSQAGLLEGSAQLGNLGNAVLTAHVWDAMNKPGPFYGLEKLTYGDQVIVHAWGDEYVYEVREVLSVKPENVKAMMKHQEKAWLTLVTCQGYDEVSGEYEHRILVRAVLMEVR